MIYAVFVFNNHGKPRLMKFYSYVPESKQQNLLTDLFQTVSSRPRETCSFVEKRDVLGGNCRIMYRHFTTLYFVFCCDASESELAILDLIQVYVEALDKCFRNVCELDLIFHVDKAHFILNELILGGVVLETDIDEILSRYEDQERKVADDNRIAPVIAMPSLPSIDLSQHLHSLRDFKVSDNMAYAIHQIGGI